MFGDVWIDDLGDRRSRRRRIAHSGWDEASTKRWDRFRERGHGVVLRIHQA